MRFGEITRDGKFEWVETGREGRTRLECVYHNGTREYTAVIFAQHPVNASGASSVFLNVWGERSTDYAELLHSSDYFIKVGLGAAAQAMIHARNLFESKELDISWDFRQNMLAKEAAKRTGGLTP